MNKRNKTDFIIIHCAATRPSLDIGATEIRKWHKDKGWSDIGYHWVIRRNGKLEPGREQDLVGAHCMGVNSRSVGVCMVGGVKQSDGKTPEDNFTPEQYKTLLTLITKLKKQYPSAKVVGHNQFETSRGCPSFDWRKWVKENKL